MDRIKEKSGFNLDAAELLITKGFHSSSVHCSYYACLQFLKHSLKNFFDFSYDYIEGECVNSRLGTHGYIINATLNAYKSKTDLRTYQDTKRLVNDLKEFRENSDYFNIQISVDDSEKSLKMSREVIHEIKTKLK